MVDEAAVIVPPATGATAVFPGQPSSTPKGKSQTGVRRDTADSAEFRKRLDHFHVTQADTESRMLARAGTKAKLAKHPAYPTLQQVRRLRHELDQALTAPSEERYQRLAALKRKLESSRTSEHKQASPSPPQGFTSPVRHYRNEQAESVSTPSKP